ncbi:MAG: hypothetical protein Q8R28_22620 [Dehalococcoidia bacterium]|nr:hypothetical protein [Dehalococcoidia bacterium]
MSQILSSAVGRSWTVNPTSNYSSPQDIEAIFGRMEAKSGTVRLGVIGVPPRELLERARLLSSETVDIDMPVTGVTPACSESFLPKVFCATLRTVMSNALKLDLDWLLLATGVDKCDGARFIALALRELLSIPMITVENLNFQRRGHPICQSDLPLTEKVERIIGRVVKGETQMELRPCRPQFGFWGVPPHDFAVLDLFPNTTHVYGWTRCFEDDTPADLGLEMEVDPGVPTVFFAQSFCQKNALAQYLAKKHHGLYVEVDTGITKSARAKIEAFLALNKRPSW